jgi:heme-degrading monooxygenase HmoA
LAGRREPVFRGSLKPNEINRRRIVIARIWRGQASAADAPRYQDHATHHVFPSLRMLPGHRGAYLLTRETQGEVEFLAITLWDSIDSVKRFAGDNPEVAVVEPEARAILSNFDEAARHYRITNANDCEAR